MKRKITTVLVLTFFYCSIATAQQGDWENLTNKFAEYRKNTLQEKIFVHLDRTFYAAGESMWFKLYYFDGYFHRPLDISKVAYLEVVDKDSKAVIQTKVSLREGESHGQLFLPVSLSSGNYMVRAYTTWMKNFSPEFYFHQAITIVNTVRKTELTRKNEAPQYDIQFFPEGGHLVDGIRSKVAFRIIDQSGVGKDVSGAILNQRGDTIASFRPLKFGLGNFSFLPSASELYKVVIKNKSVTTPAVFPIVQTTGYTMQVSDTTQNQLKVTVRTKQNGSSDDIYLLVHTRQAIKFVQVKSSPGSSSTFLVNKDVLSEGISHLTVFNEDRQPVCERLYFVRPVKSLSLQAESDQKKYASRRKIKLDLAVNTSTFNTGSFSLAVFKDDSLQQFIPLDIQQYQFLTSDLKGTIESPSYYFSDDPSIDQATDNLMLTHGWSRFKWDEVLSKEARPLLYSPEYRGHRITGTVTNIETGAAGNGIRTYLSTPGKNIKLYGSLSDVNGYVEFEMRDFFDKRKIFVQTHLSQDSMYTVTMNNPYSEKFAWFELPSLNVTSAWKNPLTARSLSMQIDNTYFGLKSSPVKKPDIDSVSFYGAPDEKYLLDDYTRFGVMEEVMREYIHGVWVRKKDGKFVFKVPDEPHHVVFQSEPLVMIDGIPVFNIDKVMAFSPLKVQRLDVMTRKYFLGPFAFEGIVSYTTYKGDLGGFPLDPKVIALDFHGLQLHKEFFSPNYETTEQQDSRLADRRNLLFWKPDITLTGKEHLSLEFFSSDEPGVYKIIMQGMSVDGRTGSISSSFEVASPENN